MKSFLQELAEKIYKEHKPLDAVTVVFPNRRSILYFRKHLSRVLDKPAFAPRLITIEDFFQGLSDLTQPDKLELIHRLYQVYGEVVSRDEPFDKFYFWGEMLLRDFDEADKYLVNAEHLFKDLSHLKELDSSFDFLTEEQKEFLMSFWSDFGDNPTANKRKFLQVWRNLHTVYIRFREHLLGDRLAYEGMLHRDVYERLTKGEVDVSSFCPAGHTMIFAGFNALTRAEEFAIIHFIREHDARIFWDIDEYYINNEWQEAGGFFREYRDNSVLGKTFPQDVPANFRKKKTIHTYGVAQQVGQAKLMAQVLQEELLKGANPEDTLVLLPDEKLMLPVLHSISPGVEKMNVTMGFPLSSTPLFNMIELMVEMQVACKNDHFNHRQVMALLGHPFSVASDTADAQSKRKEILQHNWINIEGSWLRSGPALNQLIFREVNAADMIGYLRSIVMTIGELDSLSDVDRECVLFFVKFLNRMDEIAGASLSAASEQASRKSAIRSFLQLFRQLIRSQRIPFTGEPLKGLQVMGVLESRNLDFTNVFILSLNEGAFPAFGNKGSYIPHSIRKAYGLPTTDHQDAMYAYLFYRILQRAENVHLFYNSETDILGQGEMSRYLQQLLFESGMINGRYVLHNSMHPHEINPIVVKKDERVFNRLAQYCTGETTPREFYPTALNDYVECRLKFYFKHIAQIKEAKEIEEDLDARVLGNFLHQVMEYFYHDIVQAKKNHLIEASDLNGAERKLDHIIDKVFINAYHLDGSKEVEYEGQRLVVKEVIKSFAERIVAMDRAYAPFRLEAIESKGFRHTLPLQAQGNPVVVLTGIIDRADRKENVLRVIDYKTGRDKTEIKGTVRDLFTRDGALHNKAAFQTLLYALLYKSNADTAGMKIVPGLMNRLNLFDDNFRFGLTMGANPIDDIDQHLQEFEVCLKEMLEELYNPEIPFDQTSNLDNCRFCPYQGICYR